MKTVVRGACTFLSCILCCFCVAGVGGTLGAAAKKHHQVARFVYILLLVATTVVAWAFYNLPTWADSSSYLSVLPNFRGCNATAEAAHTDSIASWLIQHELGTTTLSVPERLCYGALSAHRVLFALMAFHVIMALATMGATGNRRALRFEVQHGWWLIKLVVLIALALMAFLVLSDTFISTYSWIALGGAIIFTVIQVLLIVEFAHRANEAIGGAARRAHIQNDAPTRVGACAGGCAVVLIAYMASIVFLVLAYSSVPAPACGPVWVGTSITLVLGIVISFGAFLAMRTGRGGLLPASIVCVYGAYLTWSAFSPFALVDMGCLDPHAAALDVDGTNTTISRIVHFATLHDLSKDAQHVIMLGAAAIALAYAAVRTTAATAGPTTMTELSARDEIVDNNADPDANEDDESERAGLVLDEDTPAPYNFAWFHFTLALASMYAAMMLTGWTHLSATVNAASEAVSLHRTGTAAYVQLGTAWLTMFLYLWTVYVPYVRSRCERSTATPAQV